jgi:hypothetical protein
MPTRGMGEAKSSSQSEPELACCCAERVTRKPDLCRQQEIPGVQHGEDVVVVEVHLRDLTLRDGQRWLIRQMRAPATPRSPPRPSLPSSIRSGGSETRKFAAWRHGAAPIKGSYAPVADDRRFV